MQAQYNKPQRDKKWRNAIKENHVQSKPHWKQNEGERGDQNSQEMFKLSTDTQQTVKWAWSSCSKTREDKRQRSAEKKASRDSSGVVETEELQESLRIHVSKSLQPIYVEYDIYLIMYVVCAQYQTQYTYSIIYLCISLFLLASICSQKAKLKFNSARME